MRFAPGAPPARSATGGARGPDIQSKPMENRLMPEVTAALLISAVLVASAFVNGWVLGWF